MGQVTEEDLLNSVHFQRTIAKVKVLFNALPNINIYARASIADLICTLQTEAEDFGKDLVQLLVEQEEWRSNSY